MDIDRDWQALSSHWRGQAVPGIDVERIRADVTKRGRTLRRVIAAEVGLTVVVVAYCALITLQPARDMFERLMFGSLGLFLLAYQVGMVWLRRRQMADGDLDAASLVDLEIRRSRTVLLYWRIGMWTCLALWLGYFAMLMTGLAMDWPLPRVSGLAGALVANVLVIPAIGLYGWWRSRLARARMARYEALGRQLRGA